MSEPALEATDEEEPYRHQRESNNHHRPASPVVDIDNGGDSKHHIEYILHGGRNEATPPTCKTRTLEYVRDVVHHDIHPGELRPHLERHAEADATEDARLEEVEVGFGALCALECDLLFDLGELELDKLVGRVSVGMDVGEDFEGFAFTVFVYEPAGGFGEPYCGEC